MARPCQSTVVKQDDSDSDQPLFKSRQKNQLASKPDGLDEGIARLDAIRKRAQGRRHFGNVHLPEGPSQHTIPHEVPRPSTRGRRKSGRPGRVKREPLEVNVNDGPQWYPVKPMSLKSKDISAASFTTTPDHRPRIWASNRTELLEILPGISKSTNGVSWASSDIPYLILEGPMWPEDCWSDRLSIEMSMIRDFSCTESHFESPTIKLESSDTQISEPIPEPPPTFYNMDGYLPTPTGLGNRTTFTEPFDLRVYQFLDSAGYYGDLAKMNITKLSPSTSGVNGAGVIPTPHTPAAVVASMSQCSCSRFRFLRGCRICGDGDVGLPTSPTTFEPQIHIADLPNNADEVDPCADIHSQGAAIQEPTHSHMPSNEKVSLLLNSYQPNVNYRTSSVRTGLSQPIDSASNSQLPSSLSQSGNVDHLEWPVIRSKSRFRQDDVDRRIPKLIPPEIQALTDAHNAGKPIVVIVCRDCVLSPVRLPPEYGCYYLGMFFLTTIHTERIESPTESVTVGNYPQWGQVIGRVKWTLRLHWTPGGEDLLPDGQSLVDPWWISTLSESGENYAIQHREYMNRKDLQNHCHNLLPLDVLSEPGPHSSDVPRGWYCAECGKLSKQVFLRHRSCSNESCQSHSGKAHATVGYAVRLEFAREHFQALPSVAPNNLVPKTASKTVSAWADGMHTYCYVIKDNVAIKHIFTSNRGDLQEEANLLFRDIQLHVELRRQVRGPGYFTHLVGSGHGTVANVAGWEDAPNCLRQARDLMTHQGQTYGETDSCSVDQLTIMAWITAGKGKGPVLHALRGVVTVLCLGADVMLSLVPKSGFAVEVNCDPCLPDAASDSEMILINPSFDFGKVEAGTESVTEIPVKVIKTPTKKADAAFTLVHGDVLVLVGDDFEAHIKRTGTTIRTSHRHDYFRRLMDSRCLSIG